MRLILLIGLLLITFPAFCQDSKRDTRCIRFDGKDDYIDFGNIYKDLKLPFTISVWIKLDSSNFFLGPVFSSRNCLSVYSGFVLVVDRNYIHIQYGDGIGSKHHAYRRGKEATVNLPPGKWHHITAVVKDNMNMELYLDGVNTGGEMTGSSMQTMDSSVPAGLATAGYFYSNDIAYRYKGALDDIRLWNRALTPGEINGSMCNPLTGQEDGLIGYWTFEERKGNVVLDKSKNKNHGKFIGEPTRLATTILCSVTKSEEK